MQLERLAKDENATYKEIAGLLHQDPLVCSEILKAANAPLYGFSREIKTLEGAISLFGIGTIRGFVLSIYIRENFNFNLDAYGITSKHFSNTATKHHAFTTLWYLRYQPSLFDILSPAAFLANLGQVLISQYLIEHNIVAPFKKALLSTIDIATIEREFCDTTAVALSAEVFDRWFLDDRLVCTLRHMDEPLHASKCDIKTAQILQCVHTLIPYNGLITEKSFSEAKERVEQYGLDMPHFLKALDKFQ